MADTHAPTPDDSPLGPPRLVRDFTAGGHELDRPPNLVLFGVIATLTVVVLLASVGIFQLFFAKSEEATARALSQPSALVANQAAKDAVFFTTWGRTTANGEPTGYRMPIPDAAALVLRHPARFKAAPAPAGWIHPDDAKQ